MTIDTGLDKLQQDVQYLMDCTAILDCIARHARGCDRHDGDLISAAYSRQFGCTTESQTCGSVRELFTQSGFAKLAGSRAGNLGDEFESFRHLPFRELGQEMFSEFLWCDGVPGPEYYDGKWTLAPSRVGDRNDRRLRYGWVIHQVVFQVD